MSGNNLTRSIIYSFIVAAMIAMFAGDAFAGRWIFTGAGWKYFEYLSMPIPDPPIDQVYVFSSTSAATPADPQEPAWVLGDTGPWTITEVTTDPFGALMPFPGTLYTLDGGGIPISGGDDAWLVSASATPNPFILGELTTYLVSTGSGDISTAVNAGLPEIIASIPPELIGPEARYQYVVDNYLTNTVPVASRWGIVAMVLCLSTIGAILLYRRRSSRTWA